MAERKYTGILCGIVVDEEGKPSIGIYVPGADGPCTMSVGYAVDLYDQIGMLLEMVGAGIEDDEDGSDGGEVVH